MINIKIGIGYNRTRIKCYKKTKQKQNANNNSFYLHESVQQKRFLESEIFRFLSNLSMTL